MRYLIEAAIAALLSGIAKRTISSTRSQPAAADIDMARLQKQEIEARIDLIRAQAEKAREQAKPKRLISNLTSITFLAAVITGLVGFATVIVHNREWRADAARLLETRADERLDHTISAALSTNLSERFAAIGLLRSFLEDANERRKRLALETLPLILGSESALQARVLVLEFIKSFDLASFRTNDIHKLVRSLVILNRSLVTSGDLRWKRTGSAFAKDESTSAEARAAGLPGDDRHHLPGEAVPDRPRWWTCRCRATWTRRSGRCPGCG